MRGKLNLSEQGAGKFTNTQNEDHSSGRRAIKYYTLRENTLLTSSHCTHILIEHKNCYDLIIS